MGRAFVLLLLVTMRCLALLCEFMAYACQHATRSQEVHGMCLHAGVQPYPNGTNDFARTQRRRFVRLVAACGHICVCVCCVGVLLCFETSCPHKLWEQPPTPILLISRSHQT